MKIRPSKHAGEVVMELNRRDEPLLSDAISTPFRLKKILVPTDAEIVLLYVAPSPAYAGGEYGVIDCSTLNAELCATGEKRLETLVAEEIREKVPAETVVRTGSATSEIIDVASQLPADMIVISTHGYSGLKHVVLGSVAAHVVRHAPCPVLVVREKEHECLA
jgi:nucleotide-binding universal stress UspA family protein